MKAILLVEIEKIFDGIDPHRWRRQSPLVGDLLLVRLWKGKERMDSIGALCREAFYSGLIRLYSSPIRPLLRSSAPSPTDISGFCISVDFGHG